MSGIVGSLFNIKGGSGPIAVMGSDGQVLTSQGLGKNCQFEASTAGGGKVIQLVSYQDTTQQTITDTATHDTTMIVQITPTSASNGLLVSYSFCGEVYDNNHTQHGMGFELQRKVTSGGTYGDFSPTIDGSVTSASCHAIGYADAHLGGQGHHGRRVGNQFWDPSTGTTSEIFYKLTVQKAGGATQTHFKVGTTYSQARTFWVAEIDTEALTTP